MTPATPPDADTIAAIREAVAQARRGDVAAAIAGLSAAASRGRDMAMLHSLAGTIACQAGDLAIGIDHLAQALALAPEDIATRASLAQALVATNRSDEAWPLLTAEQAARDPSARLWRLRGHVAQGRGEATAAIASYSHVVAAMPDDFESWNNLGNAHADDRDWTRASAAFDRAVALRPDILAIRLNQASAVAESGREGDAVRYYQTCARDFPGETAPLGELGSLLARLHRDDEALATLSRAVAMAPDDPDLAVRLGEVCVATFDPVRAEHLFKQALVIRPDHADAHLQLAILYEHDNRTADLAALIGSADRLSIDRGALDFLRALGLVRERRFADALAAMRAVPGTIEPGRRAQLIAQCHDRLGQATEAFAAFAEMNRLNALDPTDPLMRATLFRDALRRSIEITTPVWFGGWSSHAPASAEPAAPVFLVGFPRSGTTLLDTLLMGHPDVAVMEELPPLRIVEDMIGGLERLPALDGDTLAQARTRYFDEVRTRSDWRPGRTLVDKLPMNMTKVPLIHRLFPDARFILALRHPCDVVLSCFIATFKLNNAMANFLDLHTTAEVYDLAFRHWSDCRDRLPIRVETIRYEDVVVDRRTALAPVFDMLDLPLVDAVLDHQKTAVERGAVRTASYAQVIEPIYARAVGRWERYRDALEPVLPALAPWVERLGYTL